VDEIRRLITHEVNRMPNVFCDFFNAKKTFLAKHLLDDTDDAMVELLHIE
jgi:hypothetical protein